ncbi:hypothetical protein U27_06464 [Candidatus Vecturithrix granuli]|uniref:Sulfatase N-terminal domain-containing protein n=1 Tax=Vecturithrix granuli TaxID=1499967 RepID=A0A081C4H4_VECG1|nr:hypothetical protein U27_06464 [Candidatus Vecturithrix granuli]
MKNLANFFTKKKNYCLLTLLISCLSFFGCLKDQHPALSREKNLLQEFRLQFQEETQLIDFNQHKHIARYLLNGWGRTENDVGWATSKISSVVFFRYDTSSDLELELVCQAAPVTEGQSQVMEVFLNNNAAGTLILNSDNLQSYSLFLPAKLLRSGQNILTFHFTYIILVEQTERAARFQNIVFKQSKTLRPLDAAKMLQHSNTEFNMLVPLPHRFLLDLQYQNVQGVTTSIEFVNEAQKTVKQITLSPRKTSYNKTIILQDETVYKMRFITTGDPDSYIIWEQIRIYLPQEQTEALSPFQEQQGFTRLEKPDILVYVVDTLRADHLSCYGYARKTSPHLDQFAQEHALFRNAYAPASWTRASGASLVTGLLPKHHKTMLRDERLPRDLVTLAEILQENGYYTAAFSTNPNISQVFGFKQGFQKFVRFSRKDGDMSSRSDNVNRKVFEFLETFLMKQERPPLFLLIWTIDPHAPYTPPQQVQTLFDIEQYNPVKTEGLSECMQQEEEGLTDSQREYIKTRYDQEIFFNDRSFGELVLKMKEFNIYDDAIILFTADHGEEFFEHGGIGHGHTLYNEQIKIPFVIKSPHIPPAEYDQRVQLIDFYPTILEILGINAPYPLDGISLLSPPLPDRILYFEEERDDNKLQAILDSEKKVIFNEMVSRPLSHQDIPVFELFANHDAFDQHCLSFTGFMDEYLKQRLLSYKYSKSSFEIRHAKVDISPELDQRLKELGYVK